MVGIAWTYFNASISCDIFVFMPISFARYSLDEWSVPTVQQSESLHP
jgi:hypothetical protein